MYFIVVEMDGGTREEYAVTGGFAQVTAGAATILARLGPR